MVFADNRINIGEKLKSDLGMFEKEKFLTMSGLLQFRIFGEGLRVIQNINQ